MARGVPSVTIRIDLENPVPTITTESAPGDEVWRLVDWVESQPLLRSIMVDATQLRDEALVRELRTAIEQYEKET